VPKVCTVTSLCKCINTEQVSAERRRLWDRWFMMGSIGITVALIGWTLFLAIEQLAKGKYHAVRCARARAPHPRLAWPLRRLCAAHNAAAATVHIRPFASACPHRACPAVAAPPDQGGSAKQADFCPTSGTCCPWSAWAWPSCSSPGCSTWRTRSRWCLRPPGPWWPSRRRPRAPAWLRSWPTSTAATCRGCGGGGPVCGGRAAQGPCLWGGRGAAREVACW